VSGTGALSGRIVHRLTERGETVACAESLTAGLLSAAIADTPGASVVLLGGVVAYAPRAKAELLGVQTGLIDRVGTVDAAIAAAMAEGVRERFHATWGLATTGVAGPGPAEGKPAGTVHVGLAGPEGTETWQLQLTGSRAEVRRLTVARLLELVDERLGRERQSAPPVTGPRGTVGRTAETTRQRRGG
jgi:nicotinamide-nucleotide amidase